MDEFWDFFEEFIARLPTTEEEHRDAQTHGWRDYGRSRYPWTLTRDSDSDVADLDDLEAFGLLDDSSWPSH